MLKFIKELGDKILNGYEITFDEAMELVKIKEENELELLYKYADEIRDKYCGDSFDVCTIMNVKSGKCSEDCSFCAQSAHYETKCDTYDLLNADEIVERAVEMEESGAKRFSLVSSGRNLSDNDLKRLVPIYKRIKEETGLKVCASHGLLTKEQAKELKEAGVDRYHHNLESSKEHYEKVCTTHSFEDRVDTIKAVVESDLDICSGGIFGIGEGEVDRIKMAFELRKLGIKSIPVNILNPIEGTPLSASEKVGQIDALKMISIFRCILPQSFIRYGGGRSNFDDNGKKGLKAGVNAALVGNYLTTVGNSIDEDMEMIKEAGYKISDC
ncbi:MAG: biotin synthase BioB [Firmicutes bacterium]|jgi:biotin synthase|nr:biotin synthase BioB [Bacillota bacterium]